MPQVFLLKLDINFSEYTIINSYYLKRRYTMNTQQHIIKLCIIIFVVLCLSIVMSGFPLSTRENLFTEGLKSISEISENSKGSIENSQQAQAQSQTQLDETKAAKAKDDAAASAKTNSDSETTTTSYESTTTAAKDSFTTLSYSSYR